MTATELEDMLRALYGAYGRRDADAINAMLTDDVVMHVPGCHPLSGSHRGRDAAWTYLGRVAAVAQGEGGFQVRSVAADDAGHAAVLVVGTIQGFVRPLVHIYRAAGPKLAEYREVPFDQASEDAFWNAR